MGAIGNPISALVRFVKRERRLNEIEAQIAYTAPQYALCAISDKERALRLRTILTELEKERSELTGQPQRF